MLNHKYFTKKIVVLLDPIKSRLFFHDILFYFPSNRKFLYFFVSKDVLHACTPPYGHITYCSRNNKSIDPGFRRS